MDRDKVLSITPPEKPTGYGWDSISAKCQQVADWERVKKLVEALEKIALASNKPNDYEWYDSWGDPVGVDISNNGDWYFHGIEMGRWSAAVVARQALAELGVEVKE